MKIEKLSDSQIRCTLTREDLAMRHIKISELAYGSEKAKNLFRDMMQQASSELGFEANNIPLMIEAIPLPSESIILIITKVDDPEELDTRFAKFAPSDGSDSGYLDDSPVVSPHEGADDILGLLGRIRDSLKKVSDMNGSDAASSDKEDEAMIDLTRLYKFKSLDTVIQAARILDSVYHGANSLYKDGTAKEYHLLVNKSNHSPEEFNKICNILSEYGQGQKLASGMEAFYAEHIECLIRDNALQHLAEL